jgi:hypothetical protein
MLGRQAREPVRYVFLVIMNFLAAGCAEKPILLWTPGKGSFD